MVCDVRSGSWHVALHAQGLRLLKGSNDIIICVTNYLGVSRKTEDSYQC